jgi:hypothetical protein
MSGIQQWLCGACGGVHGWSCPYFGGPGRYNPPPMSKEDGQKERNADKKAKRGPFAENVQKLFRQAKSRK